MQHPEFHELAEAVRDARGCTTTEANEMVHRITAGDVFADEIQFVPDPMAFNRQKRRRW